MFDEFKCKKEIIFQKNIEKKEKKTLYIYL